MKIISEIAEVSDGFLFTPWYHRISPNIRSDSYINCVLLAGRDHGLSDIAQKTTPEIFCSQFPFRAWGDIWHIDILFHDIPGMLHKAAEVLAGLDDINVLSIEVMPVHAGYASVHFVVDLSMYGDAENPDGSTKDRRKEQAPQIQFLVDSVIVGLLKGIVLTNGRPQIAARRLSELHAVSRLIHDRMPQFDEPINNGLIEIPSRRAWDAFTHNIKRPAHDPTKALVLVTSDTQQSYIKFSNLPERKYYTTAEVTMSDRAGRLRECTRIIKEAGLNIITAYEDLRKSGDHAVWRVLLEYDPLHFEIQKVNNDADFPNYISELLEEFGEDDKHYKLDFPQPMSLDNDPHLKASRELKKAILAIAKEKLPEPSLEELSRKIAGLNKIPELQKILFAIGTGTAVDAL